MTPAAPRAAQAPQPDGEPGRAGLAALLAAPDRALIALDFDGTLSPIVADPADARPLPQAIEALRALAPRVGTLAVITGRPAAGAVRLGGLDQVPGIFVLGHYGRQRWHDGELTAPPAPPGVAQASRALPAVLAAASAPAGVWTEDKDGDAVAVHTRRASDPQAALEGLRGPLAVLAEQTGLVAEPGRLVIELRPPGSDKGAALTGLVAQRQAGAVLYCGDDLGDVAAFRAVAQLRERGLPGLAVCSGSAEVAALAEVTDLTVDGPSGVADLLAYLVSAF